MIAKLWMILFSAMVLTLVTGGTAWAPSQLGGLQASGYKIWQQDLISQDEASAEKGDQFGRTLAVGDFNGDGVDDLAVSSPWEAVGWDHGCTEGLICDLLPGAPDTGLVIILYGSPAGGLSTSGYQVFHLDLDSPGWPGAEGFELFGSLLTVGDFNGDGFDDLVAGSDPPTPGINGQDAYVLFGAETGLSLGFVITPNDLVPDYEMWYFTALAAGDFNSDGYDELVLGNPDGGGGFGRVMIIQGTENGFDTASYQLFGPELANAAMGIGDDIVGDPKSRINDFACALSVGDFNGDGIEDLAVGDPGADEGGNGWTDLFGVEHKYEDGAVYVFFGSSDEDYLDLSGGQILFASDPKAKDRFGEFLTAGDFDGNGYADLAVGNIDNKNLFEVPDAKITLIYGSSGGLSSNRKLFTITSPTNYWLCDSDGSPLVVLAAGDFNRDGSDDLVFSQPHRSDGKGAFFVSYEGLNFLDPLKGQIWSQDTGGLNGMSAENCDFFGGALAAGDFNNDGTDDLAIGSPGEDLLYADNNDEGMVVILKGKAGQGPVADAGGPYTVDEGSNIEVSGAGSYSPTGSPLTYEWDLVYDGENFHVSGSGSGMTATFIASHLVGGTQWEIALRVTDENGLRDIAVTTVTVVKTEGVDMISAGQVRCVEDEYKHPLTEGDTVKLLGAGIQKHPSLDPADYTATISWGDGSAPVAGTFEVINDISSWIRGTHFYADNGTYTVLLTVTYTDDGSQFSDTATAALENVAPTAEAGPDQTVNEGEAVTFSGSFTDPGTADTHTVVWDFGDSSATTGTLTPSHIYALDGVYTVTLTVVDDDGGVGTDTLTITVNALPEAISIDNGCAAAGSDITITMDVGQGNDTYFSYWLNETSYCSTEAARWIRIYPDDEGESWTTENEITWTPTTEGRKTVVVWMTDDPLGSGCPEMVGLSYEVGASSSCTDPLAVSVTPEEGTVGEEATIKVTGSGNVLYYKFFVNTTSYCDDPEHPSWQMLQDWSDSNTCTWTPTEAGLCTLVVWTTDDPNNTCRGMGGRSYRVEGGEEVLPLAARDQP